MYYIKLVLVGIGLFCCSCNTCLHLTHKINQVTDNKKYGLWILKNDTNGIITIMSYNNNLVVGRYTEYYENGNIRTTGNYCNGKEVGVWKYYSPDGLLTLKRKYRKGEIIVNKIYNISW
jgi:antitoxin component YwqK of YwqJK toxin-antitoxin module